jgi:hypothetical protein
MKANSNAHILHTYIETINTYDSIPSDYCIVYKIF